MAGLLVVRESAGGPACRARGQGVDLWVELNHMALNLDTGTKQEVRQYLEGHGIKVFGRPGDETCLYFEDPDGHRLQVLPTDHNQ